MGRLGYRSNLEKTMEWLSRKCQATTDTKLQSTLLSDGKAIPSIPNCAPGNTGLLKVWGMVS